MRHGVEVVEARFWAKLKQQSDMKNPFKGLFKKPYTDEQVTQASGDERNRRLIANDGYIGDSVLRILFAVAIAAMATALIHAIANAI